MFLGNPMMIRRLASGPNIANLFNTTAYTGTGAARTGLGGLNFTANGGMAWIKHRTAGDQAHKIYDTVRGGGVALGSHLTSGNAPGWETTFTSTGLSIGNGFTVHNANGASYVLWSFARAARFFDVVTWAGNASNRTIAHSLGVAPGLILVKRTDASADWQVFHRSLANTDYLVLNSTAASASGSTRWNSTTATDSVFSLGTDSTVNASGGTYIAYLFAHDTASDGVVQSGSYTGNGSVTGPTISLGWQPQWLMIKRTDTTGDWWMYDSVRSTSNPRILKLLANSLAAEDTAGEDVDFLADGIQPKTTAAGINANGGTYTYLAIRAAA